MIIVYSENKKNKDVILDMRDTIPVTLYGYKEITPDQLKEYVVVVRKNVFIKNGTDIENNKELINYLKSYAEEKHIDGQQLVTRFKHSARDFKTIQIKNFKTRFIAAPLFKSSEQLIGVTDTADKGKHMCFSYGGCMPLMMCEKIDDQKIYRDKQMYLNFIKLTNKSYALSQQKDEENGMTI